MVGAVPLFRRELTVCVLASGSSGNCTYIGDGRAGVLVDCGISTRQIMQRMEQVGLGGAPIDAVVLTHEHSDHVGSAAVLSRALAKKGKAVPFFSTRGTHDASDARCQADGAEFVRPGDEIPLHHLRLEAMPTPHDARDPVAWRVRVGGAMVGVITDLGRPTSLIAHKMQECDVLVLEFNHDEAMLMDGPYPYPLKQRIRGAHGHLSNNQAAELLRQGMGASLRQLVLAHLSEQNNKPELARQVAASTLRELDASQRVGLHVASQHTPTPLRLEVSAF